MEELIIAKARQLMKSRFMDYPDYDESIETTFADALTILLMDNFNDHDEIGSCEMYDFLITKLK